MAADYQNTSVLNNGFKFATLISWRAVFAGLAVTMLTFFGLMALAIAMGGIGLDEGTSFQSAGLFTVISALLAIIISIFAGSYFSVRLAQINAEAIGSSQGLLVGALFVLFVLFQLASAMGTIGRVTGGAIGAAGTGVTNAVQNPVIQDIIQDQFANLNLKSDPQTVMEGVASRLLRGDQESAKNYLSRQAGISPQEAEQKIVQARTQIDGALQKAREASSTALKTTGWSMFSLIVLSVLASVLGGFFATKRNETYTLDMRARNKAAKPLQSA